MKDTRIFVIYTKCNCCGFRKHCKEDGDKMICRACARDDLTLEQKRGKHEPTRSYH